MRKFFTEVIKTRGKTTIKKDNDKRKLFNEHYNEKALRLVCNRRAYFLEKKRFF